ncbi:MAG: SDR family oxidoreductase, partial [Lewinella sp.]|nr:SDR family oxidoreductase [Lewinella sp.]
SGIGQAIAQLFARQGAQVYILDLNEQAARETIEGIRQEGGAAHFQFCNVVELDTVQQAIETILAAAGHIDIIVNNAGVAHIGNAETTTPADMDRLLSVNVKGVYHILHAALPRMKDRGGVILNMASIAAFVGLEDRFAYSTTKGAVATMTLSVAKDYLPYGIRCNSISPARVHTPFVDGFLAQNYPGREQEVYDQLAATQPIGRMAKPYEIACLALYLCSDEASFITGTDYLIDGGFIKLNT